MWQNIETAPKDGSWVLILIPGGRMLIARRWTEIFQGDNGLGIYIEPTHWHPLPETPGGKVTSEPARDEIDVGRIIRDALGPIICARDGRHFKPLVNGLIRAVEKACESELARLRAAVETYEVVMPSIYAELDEARAECEAAKKEVAEYKEITHSWAMQAKRSDEVADEEEKRADKAEAERDAERAACESLRYERDQLEEKCERERARADASETQLIGERDRCEEWADKLAYAIAHVEDIGEHSNLNKPWEAAYNLLTSDSEVREMRDVEKPDPETHSRSDAARTPSSQRAKTHGRCPQDGQRTRLRAGQGGRGGSIA